MKMDSHRVVFANAASWIATIVSMEFIRDFLQIAALLGSICVSVSSVWWIRRQAALKDKENKQ